MSTLIAGIPGWFIPVIILIVSVLALTIILERGWTLLKKFDLINTEKERELVLYLRNKDYDTAASFCRSQIHPAYKVALAMIEARNSEIDIKAISDEEILNQLNMMEKYLPTLGTISTIAPLLGLLGTVTGMIKSFRAFEDTGSRSAQLMGGIDEALITTALGLIVAIPALIMYNYYIRRVNTLTEETNILVQMVQEELKKDSRIIRK
ncbi:MAG: MotA/TolQ/ExbB proton channel family protein [Spirochaetia bacterium]|nr:MotA/TolQ/ExbB proton channel family protein [Spirochaetia bacterium]